MIKKKNVVLSLSGGMDSSTLLLRCLNEYENVTCISFLYGQKHKIELERARSLVDYLNEQREDGSKWIDQNTPPYSFIKYQVIKLDGLSNLLNSALVEGGWDVPEGHYEQENMKDTVVPNRNKIFASIVQAIALSIATKTNSTCDIALGIHAGDHFIYPDCRKEFRDADDQAFRLGNWESERVGYFTPYLETDKFGILQDGEILCNVLELDFNDVYSKTNTSYKPIFIQNPNFPDKITNIISSTNTDPIFGVWYSDYKSASSVERIEAFIKLGRPDPVKYADETGPVTWEHVIAEVSKVLFK